LYLNLTNKFTSSRQILWFFGGSEYFESQVN
jgi:hypothetical protein